MPAQECIPVVVRFPPAPMERASLDHLQELPTKDQEPDQNFQSVAASGYLDS